MNALLVAINAKYIHTNIAVRYLQKFAAPHLSEPPRILEMTINNRTDQILDEIFRHDPQVLLFSTYIWNVRMVQDLAREYRKIRPDVLIAAGGPEVSYESAAFLRENPAFRLSVTDQHSSATYELVANGEADLGIISDERYLKGVRTVPLFREKRLKAACIFSRSSGWQALRRNRSRAQGKEYPAYKRKRAQAKPRSRPWRTRGRALRLLTPPALAFSPWGSRKEYVDFLPTLSRRPLELVWDMLSCNRVNRSLQASVFRYRPYPYSKPWRYFYLKFLQ